MPQQDYAWQTPWKGPVIIDHLLNAQRYGPLNPGIDLAIKFLQRPDLVSLAPGRYDLKGDDVYALVSEYTSSPMSERRWEAHHRYLDLQYVISGSERIGYAPVSRMHAEPYDEARDILWLSGTGDYLALLPGLFMLLWPDDAHMPGVADGVSIGVRKVVVKIRVHEDQTQPSRDTGD
jgi:YhcH/YjgK/YiaL family protein